MNPTRWPIGLRIALATGIVLLLGGAGLFAYRWYERPMTLTIAAGSLDGEASRLVSALAAKLAQSNAPVRLSVMQTSNVLESASAFSSEKVDLAVVRADVGDLAHAQAVLVLAQAVALLVAPPGSAISDLSALKRATIGVVNGETNQKLISVLIQEYDLARANVTFKNLAPSEVRRAFESKEVRAVLFVLPLTEKYLSLVRDALPQNFRSSPVLIALESAGAISERERAYESFDVPKGTLRGAPPIPADDITTLKTSFYLVAQKKLGNDLIADLTQALMNARRDLLAEMPMLAQITAPDTDADAYLPVHPGAAEFYNGTRQSFLDKWGNAIFLAPMIAGALFSVLAAAWRFLRAEKKEPTKEEALDALYTLGPRIRETERSSELDQIEREIDDILRAQRAWSEAGEESERNVTAVNVAAHRLENLIHDRRLALASQQNGKPSA